MPTDAVPRIVDDVNLAQTPVGLLLQVDELRRRAGKASTALLWAAALQTLGCAFLFLQLHASRHYFTQSDIVSFVLTASFWGLYSWSQSQPLGAAVAGLTIYGTCVGINLMVAVKAIIEDFSTGRHPTSYGVTIFDLVVLVLLARAVSAGAKHRRLQQVLA